MLEICLPSLMNKLPFSQVRFFGITSNHNRMIHFKTSNANTLSSLKTGVGNSLGLRSNLQLSRGIQLFARKYDSFKSKHG